MTDGLEGWELVSESESEVSYCGEDGGSVRFISSHKRYTKKIDGVWYYRDVVEKTPMKRREYKDIDGKNEPFYEWVKEDE